MRLISSVLVALYSVALTEAAKINWTLHKSCYTDSNGQPDDVLRDKMVDAMVVVKAWAAKASPKLEDAASNNPFTGRDTKKVIQAFLSNGDFSSNARDVKAKFDRLGDLEGPIGADGDDPNKKYDMSDAWKALGDPDDTVHYNDFLLVCRPQLREEGFAMYDEIRQNEVAINSDLHNLWIQSQSGTAWNDFQGEKIVAVTVADLEPPAGDRKKVPAAIYFNSAWIAEQRGRDPPFSAWTDQLFADVTRKDAESTFADKSAGKDVDLRPVDALYAKSFHRNLFHELFHLKAFGGMNDDPQGAYLFANNAKYQNRENPDLMALIAVNIELLKTLGYVVNDFGSVSKA